MSDSPIIVLTNDDGIDAPGIAALQTATAHLSGRRVVAPDSPQSGCGHTATTHRAISLTERPDRSFAVGGTPADCVRVALHRFNREGRITWVLSGINAGGNLGADLHHSGTVAAVREAALNGLSGVAISHYIAKGRAVDWDQGAAWTARVLQQLMARPLEPGTFWNVNLPHLDSGSPQPEVVFCPVDVSPLPVEFREEAGQLIYSGNYQGRVRREFSDVSVCFGGRIAVSLVPVTASIWPIEG